MSFLSNTFITIIYFEMSFLVCQHRPFQCIQVWSRGLNTCITNFNHLTTVADIIRTALINLSESQHSTIHDCSLYIENPPYLLALQSTDFIQDILYRYISSNIHFKLVFKRSSSPSRFAQRKQLRTPSTTVNPYEQLRIQELLIQKQQEIIHRLAKVNDEQQRVSTCDTRRSRQDTLDQSIHRDASRSHSQVRFRLSTAPSKQSSPAMSSSSSSSVEVKSILKKSPMQRNSSVDRDIDQLVSLKHESIRFCPTDDDHLSDASGTDSCLGSLSSNDSVFRSIPQQQHFETLV